MTHRRFRKDDIEYHDGGYTAINIKVHDYMPDIIRKYRAPGVHEVSDDADFWAWLDEQWEAHDDGRYQYPNIFDTCWEWACESVYEQTVEDIMEILDVDRKRIWTAGRSGGWLIVDFDYSDVESWDAIAVSKWGKCVRYVNENKPEVGYQTIWNLRYNIYERILDEQRDDAFITFSTLAASHGVTA